MLRPYSASGGRGSQGRRTLEPFPGPPHYGHRATEEASMDHYDVIIIGTGAGGGTLAHRLASSGKRILLLERGRYVPREKENWDTKAVVLEGRYGAKEEWRD